MADSWLRLHTDVLDNPKIRQLPPKLFMVWVLSMAIAKRHAGILPDIARYAFELRISENDAKKTIEKLIACQLVDNNDGIMAMHDWGYWQFENVTDGKQKSSAAIRMQRLRERQRNGIVTERNESVTSRNELRNESVTNCVTNVTCDASRARTDSDSDSDTECSRNALRPTNANPLRSAVAETLDRICELHPKSDGIARGRKLLEAELASAVNPEELAVTIEARHRIYVESNRNTQKRFVKSLANWVRDNGFMDPLPKVEELEYNESDHYEVCKPDPAKAIEREEFYRRQKEKLGVRFDGKA